MISFLFVSVVVATIPICFQDGTCYDMSTFDVSTQDAQNVSKLCTVYLDWARDCPQELRTASGMFSNDTTSYEYNLGLASEEYTLGFGLYHANEQMRDRNGTNIDVVNKNPVLLTAASLNWHRKRNRYFLDSISLVLFRSQPVLPSSDCQFDPNTPYVKLSSNYTSMAFMSLSTSALFPLEWIFQQEAWMPGISSKPVSVLVVYRDQTSSSSAGYMWPVSVTSQTEAVYVPGKQFFNLACRRQVVTLPLDGRSLQVAYTLMYEADSGVRQSARNEARIEQALNAAIDATNTTCSPQLCASLVWRSIPAVQKLSQPTALACVDLTSKQVVSSGRSRPHRPIANAQCQVIDSDTFHFIMFGGGSPIDCLAAIDNNGVLVLAVAVCDASNSQTFFLHRQSGNKFIMELQGSNLCVDPSGQLTNGAIALRNCTTLIGGGGGGAMSMIDSALLSARGDHLVAQQQTIRPSLMHWASSWQGLWFQGMTDEGAQITSRFSNPPALRQQL